MNELLDSFEDLIEETYLDVISRYPGFGHELYSLLKDYHPEVFKRLTFYKRLELQTEDSYAVYDDGPRSFAIQLDPLCEVIVLWNHEFQTEIGTWCEDPVEEALHLIGTEMIK